jgi:hypothetical protein
VSGFFCFFIFFPGVWVFALWSASFIRTARMDCVPARGWCGDVR